MVAVIGHSFSPSHPPGAGLSAALVFTSLPEPVFLWCPFVAAENEVPAGHRTCPDHWPMEQAWVRTCKQEASTACNLGGRLCPCPPQGTEGTRGSERW